MAANDNLFWNNAATTAYYPVVTSGNSNVTYFASGGVSGGGGGGLTFTGGYVPERPCPPSALEWLDAEVERTCALAR